MASPEHVYKQATLNRLNRLCLHIFLFIYLEVSITTKEKEVINLRFFKGQDKGGAGEKKGKGKLYNYIFVKNKLNKKRIKQANSIYQLAQAGSQQHSIASSVEC